MSFRILYVAATKAEAVLLNREGGSLPDGVTLETLVTGVGVAATIYSLKHYLDTNLQPDLIINGGIAGSYRREIEAGEVVTPVSDCFADYGIEDGDRRLDLFEAGLAEREAHPFSGGRIKADLASSARFAGNLRRVDAVTVSCASGSASTIAGLAGKYDPDIETMEGAAFFYVCSIEKIPFVAVRAISNLIEPRNRAAWNISLALGNLEKTLVEIIIQTMRP